MKKISLQLFALLIIILNLSSCSNSDSPTANKTQLETEGVLKTGTWKVTLFDNLGTIETFKTSDYFFVFGLDNSLTATTSAGSKTKGSWYINDVNNAVDTLEDLLLEIDFGTNSTNFLNNKNWKFISKSNSKIELKFTNSNGVNSYLTFEKK